MTARIRNFEQGIQLCWWILLAVVIAVVVFIRIHFLAIPLERDEGEYAYAGQLMLQGIPPYRLAYNMKFPGVYAAYALIMWIFGQTSTGIHLGLLIVNIANIVIVFLIARRLIGLIAGIAAAASYTILSASPSVLGLAAHATHFVMLPTLLGALVLLKPVLTKKMVFVSGILFGAGLLMKQPAMFFVCFGATYLLVRFQSDVVAECCVSCRECPAFGVCLSLAVARRCVRKILVLDSTLRGAVRRCNSDLSGASNIF